MTLAQEPAILSDTGWPILDTGRVAMLTIESRFFVAGICGSEITDFLLDCTDNRYRHWWLGTHLELHALSRRRGHVGDIVLMDEYVGTHRVRMQAVVVHVVPDKKVVWQLGKGVRLPVWLALELADRDGGVDLRHIVTAGFRGVGRVLDPLLRRYFSAEFAAAMDKHARTEFALLRDHLAETRSTS
ncbi:MAG TPA: hypothetical protein VI094_00540 [Propionibacteriaceae bacterium]